MYCYLIFKLRYLRSLKLFSSRVKEIFEPIVLQRKGDEFLLFLRAFSLENGEKRRIWEGKSVFKRKSI